MPPVSSSVVSDPNDDGDETMMVLRWVFRRLWNSQLRRYRMLSRIVTALAVVRWIKGRRRPAGRIVLGRDQNLVIGVSASTPERGRS